MICAACQARNTFVVETRQAGPYLRRRRECSSCHFRWSTMEIPVGTSTTLAFEARISLDGLLVQHRQEKKG